MEEEAPMILSHSAGNSTLMDLPPMPAEASTSGQSLHQRHSLPIARSPPAKPPPQMHHPHPIKAGNRMLRRQSSDHFAGITSRQGYPSHTRPGLREYQAPNPRSDQGRMTSPALRGAAIPRQRDKFIPLRYDEEAYFIAEEGTEEGTETDGETDDLDICQLGADDLLLSTVGKRGRITVFGVADSFCHVSLVKLINELYPTAVRQVYPEVMYLQTPFAARGGLGDVFIFDYGIVACWGLTEDQEGVLLKQLEPAWKVELADEEIQSDNFSFHYSGLQQPHIQNETITIHNSKLGVYENRIGELVEDIRYLPDMLAEHGEINMPPKEMARLMGKVFLQKSTVNLLSSVLDTPDFFWRMPDNLQTLYDSVLEYLQLGDRVELINGRFVVIQKMLKLWSNHSYHQYISRLEVVVMWLVFLEVALAAAEVAGFFWFWYKHSPKPPPSP
eukprot:gene11686-34409_t